MPPPTLLKKTIKKIDKICKFLDLDKVEIGIYPTKEIKIQNLDDCSAYFLPEKDKIKIIIRLDLINDIDTIAHELIHVRQFLDKRLEIKKDGFIFEGKKISLAEYSEKYETIKFEIEAVFWAKFLSKDRNLKICLIKKKKKSKKVLVL